MLTTTLCNAYELHYIIIEMGSLKGRFFRFFLFMYNIQHRFICRPSDSTVSEDAGFEPRTVCDYGVGCQTL